MRNEGGSGVSAGEGRGDDAGRVEARRATEASSPSTDAAPSSEGVRVRPMAEADLDRVSEIETQSFSVPWKRKTFRDLLPRGDAELWVAEIEPGSESEPPPASTASPGSSGESVIAHLVVWFASDEAELADVAVAPEHRGRGLGGRLVEHATARARARGARSLFLEVRASNARALSLYRSRGFHVISVRKGYYSRPREDALVMLKSLW